MVSKSAVRDSDSSSLSSKRGAALAANETSSRIVVARVRFEMFMLAPVFSYSVPHFDAMPGGLWFFISTP
jgi:hypothetical protein